MVSHARPTVEDHERCRTWCVQGTEYLVPGLVGLVPNLEVNFAVVVRFRSHRSHAHLSRGSQASHLYRGPFLPTPCGYSRCCYPLDRLSNKPGDHHQSTLCYYRFLRRQNGMICSVFDYLREEQQLITISKIGRRDMYIRS